jgi:hypothetical protein
MFKAAIYFKTSVYVHCTQAHISQLFSKDVNLKSGEKCLYLINQNNTQYEVVLYVIDIEN